MGQTVWETMYYITCAHGFVNWAVFWIDSLREFEKEELAEKEARRQERRAAQGLPNDTEEARLKVEEEALARAKARKKNDSDNEIEEEYEESDSEGEDGEIEEED